VSVFYVGETEEMKEASIEIETYGPMTILKDFFENKELLVGREIKIDNGVSLRFDNVTFKEAIQVAEVIKLTLRLARDVVLPIALGVASNWLYDKIKDRRTQRVRINGIEVRINKKKIKELLAKEIREKLPLKTYCVRLSFPDFPRDEILRAARTLTDKPIIFNGGELPYPDNRVFFAEYVSGKVKATIYIRDEKVNELHEKGKPLYAKTETSKTPIFQNLLFTHLILGSRRVANGTRMKRIKSDYSEIL
jgi:hypothetical protein